MLRIERKKSKCSECSLNGETKVWGISRTDVPRIVFIGEAPGEQESREGEPFIGPAGKLLRKAASEAGINWPTAYKMNCISCRPPKNKINSFEGLDALEKCRSGFDEEAAGLDQVKVIVPLGNTASRQVGIEEGIGKARGSIYEVEFGGKIVPAVPTYHPSFIIRGGDKQFPTMVNDLMKAMRVAREGYKPPKEDFELFPTLEFLEIFVEECEEERPLVSVDIETTGFNPDKNEIVMIGFATSGSEAVVIPFTKQGGGDYWTKDELPVAKDFVQRLLNLPTMFQNALFDVRQLRAKGFHVPNVDEDTMLLHHAIHPELPHDLGYIVSIYGETPYWKGEMLDNMKGKMDVDDSTFRTYNARDAVVLHQVLPAMKEDLSDSGTEESYTTSMRLIDPILEMIESGLPLDSERLKKFKDGLEKKKAELNSRLYEISGCSPKLSVDSNQDLAYLLYGAKPNSYEKAKKALEQEYGEGSNKRTDTKKYRELIEKVEKVDETAPLEKPRGWSVPRTESGAKSTNEETLLSMKQAAVKRIEAIDRLKRPTEEHGEERRKLDRLIEFLDVYREYADTYKLASTYTKFPVGLDGRVHGSYLIHGTASGRLCVSPDTFVEVPQSSSAPKKRVKDLSVGDFVYSFDEDRELCLRPISWVGPTEVKETLIIHTDKGPPLTVSKDHLIRLWRGHWKHAKDVKVGDRLLCMPKIGNYNGYELKPETIRKYRSKLRANHVVTSIEEGPVKQLWDLEVEGTHTFIGNDVALHNSSRQPNMQNIPKEAKPVFHVSNEDESVLIQADYSNLELRVLAIISEDDVLQGIFDRGENVHDNNTRLLFGIDEDHPKWKEIRRASKIYIFGRNYGGSLRGVYQKVVKEVPDVRLTWKRFQEIDSIYRSEHPRYAQWYDRTVEEVLSTRKLRNAFGRLRIFLGSDAEVVRAGLNYPIQSTAADILNLNLIKMYDHLKDNRDRYQARLIGTVHDSVLLECSKGAANRTAEMVKTFLEAPVLMGWEEYSFPVDLEMGLSWGELDDLEV